MITEDELPAWLERGVALECFDTLMKQAEYYDAWTSGDIDYVIYALEAVFTRRHRMPALNWLAHAADIERLDSIEDAPPRLIEDWRDSDFAIKLPNDQFVSPAWLLQEGAWSKLLVGVARIFIFASSEEKIATAIKWERRVTELVWQRPVRLADLVEAATWGQFIALSAASSESLKVVLPMYYNLADNATLLRLRAIQLLNGWETVLQTGHAHLLTLSSLRRCTTTFEADALLAATTVAATNNLMTYLRCLPES